MFAVVDLPSEAASTLVDGCQLHDEKSCLRLSSPRRRDLLRSFSSSGDYVEGPSDLCRRI